MKRLLRSSFFIRLRYWEYWNSRVIYAPLYCYWLWLAMKARSVFFLTAANPSITNGGFVMESKSDIYKLLPPGSYPLTCHFLPGTPADEVLAAIATKEMKFPLIAKPDYGERGLAVKKITDPEALEEYVLSMPIPFLVQEYVAYENEIGIFYYRFPGETYGRISGIVLKEPMNVAGDGKSTLHELILQEPRYVLQLPALRKLYQHRLSEILPQGEKMVLMPYGNHSRGSKFTNVSDRISPALEKTIDKLCKRIPDLYYGRLDVRFASWEALERGEELAIIEVNGSGSEPKHIYDPSSSLLSAWKEIIRHWKILYRVSTENNRRGTPYLSFREGRQAYRTFRRIDKALSALS